MSMESGRSPLRGSGHSPSGLSQSSLSQAQPSVPNAEPSPYGEPVSTVAELDTLDSDEIVEGYRDGRNNEPPPTGNRSKAYWHGWRNGMADAGHMELDGAMRQLAHEVVEQSKREKAR
jgi:hypothetical protein